MIPLIFPKVPQSSRPESFPEKEPYKYTLPETNSLPLEMVVSNKNLLFQGSIFRGRAVSFRECSWHFQWQLFIFTKEAGDRSGEGPVPFQGDTPKI